MLKHLDEPFLTRGSLPVLAQAVGVALGTVLLAACAGGTTEAQSGSVTPSSLPAVSPPTAKAGSVPSSGTAATPPEPIAPLNGAPLPATTPQGPIPTANLDPSDDDLVGPPEVIEDCEARLRAEGVTFKPASLPVFKKRDAVCGAHQAVQYVKGPTGIRFEPSPVVTCPLALSLARFEALVQRVSLQKLGRKVTRITQGGTYNCRPMARFKMASEHSYGNAIDLYQFILDDGSRANVLRDFGSPAKPPPNVRGEFLRELAQAAFDEAVFSVVVTRFFDELHRDHIHADMAHYRTDGTR